jgi:hypothetical protein
MVEEPEDLRRHGYYRGAMHGVQTADQQYKPAEVSR